MAVSLSSVRVRGYETLALGKSEPIPPLERTRESGAGTRVSRSEWYGHRLNSFPLWLHERPSQDLFDFGKLSPCTWDFRDT